MKRHTRPYGCTFPTCKKSFGSKNDWKRHETSQHYQHETWRCDEKTDGASCTKVFFSADIARAHLTKVHKVTDPTAIERKIDERRMGASSQGNFWCGFCEKIISLNEKGVDAWTEKYNHVDDHFMGKNGRPQNIEEWKPADPEGDQASPKPRSSDEADRDSSDDSSPTSSDSPPVSQTISAAPTISEAGPVSQKRKRTTSDEKEDRPSKHSRHSMLEVRIQCVRDTLYDLPSLRLLKYETVPVFSPFQPKDSRLLSR
jgi:hypothetical protein